MVSPNALWELHLDGDAEIPSLRPLRSVMDSRISRGGNSC